MLNTLAVSLFVLLSTFPLSFVITQSFYDDSRIFSVLTIVFLNIGFSLSLLNGQRPRDQRTEHYLFLIGLTGLILTVLIKKELTSLLNFFNITLLLTIALAFSANKSQVKVLLGAIFWCSLALISYCYLNLIFAILDNNYSDPFVLITRFDNIRFFNQFQIFALTSTLLFINLSRFKRVAYFNLFSQLLFLFLTGGRAATLSWLAIVFLVYICKFKRKHAHTALLMTILAFTMYLFFNYLLTKNLDAGYLIRSSTSYRFEMWVESISQLGWHNVFYGYGGGNYIHHTKISAMAHPHNLILQVLAEWGFLYLCALTGLVVLAVKRNIKHILTSRYDTTSCVFFAFISMLINAQFDGSFINPVAQLLSFVFLGILLQNRTPTETHKDKIINSYNVVSCGTAAIILVISTGLVYLSWIYFQAMLANPSPFFGPYFWLYGDSF